MFAFTDAPGYIIFSQMRYFSKVICKEYFKSEFVPMVFRFLLSKKNKQSAINKASEATKTKSNNIIIFHSR